MSLKISLNSVLFLSTCIVCIMWQGVIAPAPPNRQALMAMAAFDEAYDDFDDDYVRALATVSDCGTATTTAATKTTKKSSVRNYGGLCQEFTMLRNVLPMEKLIRITTNRFRRDAKFRHALNFIRTSQFRYATELIEDSDAYQQLILRFEDAGVNSADLLSISRIFDCLLLPLIEIGGDVDINDYQKMSFSRGKSGGSNGGLAGYAQDVWHAVPRQTFEQTLKKQTQTNPEFAGFYQVMQSVGVRQDILRALANPEIAEAVRILRRNYIDLRQLLLLVSRIFANGPRM